MILNREEKQKRWIIGVSGGADSMALLHYCIQRKLDVIVAHMNYGKRESAQRDTDGVQRYCKMHDVPCVVVYQQEACTKNFQAFAREKRYAFFYELCQKYDADGVLVAHHLDDHLETYLMQKQRHAQVQYYGIARVVYLFGCHVVRPFLTKTKAQLEAYCEKHGVPYYLDESNLSDAYTRNKIRHRYIDKMCLEEKKALAITIKKENQKLLHRQKQITSFLQEWNGEEDALLKQSDASACLILQTWGYQTMHAYLSEKQCLDILHALRQSQKHWKRKVHPNYELIREYKKLYLLPQTGYDYAYIFHAVEEQKTPFFKTTFTGAKIEGITLTKADFPITIRNAKEKDFIQLRFGKKKLNRWFIDRKLPTLERRIWPVVENAQGQVIFVAKIGCDIEHFTDNPNIFVVK